MFLLRDFVHLNEGRTAQTVGYHATDRAGAAAILKSGKLSANPPSQIWDGTKEKEFVKSAKDSVYLSLDPVGTIKRFGAVDDDTYLVIVNFTLKTAKSDPHFGVAGFVYDFIYSQREFLFGDNHRDVIGSENRTVNDRQAEHRPLRTNRLSTKEKLNRIVAWSNSKAVEFGDQLHGLLSNDNNHVPNKVTTRLAKAILICGVINGYGEDTDWKTNELRDVVSNLTNKWHVLLHELSRLYPGYKFKQPVNGKAYRSVRLESDVELKLGHRNRVIGIVNTLQSKSDVRTGLVGEITDEEFKNKRMVVVYGNRDELKIKTGFRNLVSLKTNQT